MDTFLLVLGIIATIIGACATLAAVINFAHLPLHGSQFNVKEYFKIYSMVVLIVIMSTLLPLSIFLTRDLIREENNEPVQETIETNDSTNNE